MSTRPKSPKYRRVRKLWHKGLASLPGLDGKRRREQDKIELIDVGHNTQFDTYDDRQAVLARVLGSDALARTLIKLQKEKFPYGTMPELVVYEYLEKNNHKFIYQAQVLGGYRGGGLVPDFLVDKSGTHLALLIQGIYWHNIPGKREKDAADKLRLLSSNYEGKVISQVIFVWENRIMTPNPERDRVLGNAVVGVETL